MHVHFEYVGGALCLDFANSLNRLFPPSPGTDEPEDPYQRILLWYKERGDPSLPTRELESLARQEPAETRAVVRRARVLSAALREVFEAARTCKTPPAEALGVLQGEIQRLGKTAELLPQPGRAAWRWQDPPRKLDAVLGPVVRSAADLLLSGGAGGIKRCADKSCQWMFLDESRNRARKWCDMKICGNRSKVRRYRSRKS